MRTEGNMHVVIRAGGAGTRLWPISRRNRPKQFHPLLSTRTMLQETYARVRPFTTPDRVWVVTGAQFVDMAQQQLPELPPQHILGEPEPRNSAPATALAVARIARADPSAIVLDTPSDSYLRDADAYREYVALAVEVAAVNGIVTLGIVPSRPDTGYGYIQRGERLEKPITWAYRVARFTEKPDAKTAARYVADGGYYWNMGHFIFRAGVFMDRCARHLPDVAAAMRKLAAADPSDRKLIAAVYRDLPSISLDYGIMEKEQDMVVIPTALEWSDVGNWAAVRELALRHPHPDLLIASHIALDSEDSFLYSDTNRLVVTIGVHNCVIVDTPDALLIVHQDKAQEVRDALAEIEKKGQGSHL
jgi:mannose-1-phosphate guanylyltransferase